MSIDTSRITPMSVYKNIAGRVNATFESMQQTALDSSNMQSPGDVFTIQTKLQTSKNIIAAELAAARFIYSVQADAVKQFVKGLEEIKA